jgi:catechol 2,3-dioxygenase-like lactoylglutathione lyase family enzyme
MVMIAIDFPPCEWNEDRFIKGFTGIQRSSAPSRFLLIIVSVPPPVKPRGYGWVPRIHVQCGIRLPELMGAQAAFEGGCMIFRRIDHIEIVPGNPERTIDFYQGVLGFRLNMRVPVDAPPMKEVIYLELGDTVIEVISAENPSPRSGEAWQVGYRAIALEVDDMKEAVEYLRSRGVALTREPVDVGTFIKGELQDPDGLTIELREWK